MIPNMFLFYFSAAVTASDRRSFVMPIWNDARKTRVNSGIADQSGDGSLGHGLTGWKLSCFPGIHVIN